MKLSSWKQARSQRHETTQLSLGHASGISSLLSPVVLSPPQPQTELIMVWLLKIMGRVGGETDTEKLLCIKHWVIKTRAIGLFPGFHSTIYLHTGRKAVSR